MFTINDSDAVVCVYDGGNVPDLFVFKSEKEAIAWVAKREGTRYEEVELEVERMGEFQGEGYAYFFDVDVRRVLDVDDDFEDLK